MVSPRISGLPPKNDTATVISLFSFRSLSPLFFCVVDLAGSAVPIAEDVADVTGVPIAAVVAAATHRLQVARRLMFSVDTPHGQYWIFFETVTADNTMDRAHAIRLDF